LDRPHIGGHAGGAWSRTELTGNVLVVGVITASEPIAHDSSSWIAGGQLGCLYQFHPNWVAGIEVSWSGTDLTRDAPSTVFADRSRHSRISDLLLLTGRLGYASNNWLAYAKGGYANAEFDFDSSVASTGQPTSTSSGRDDGWTLGGGIEYGVHPNVSVGVEYNFVRLNIEVRVPTIFPHTLPETITDAHADLHLVWLRLNGRFGNPAGRP
jgi:outer membrane immunogenic protein